MEGSGVEVARRWDGRRGEGEELGEEQRERVRGRGRISGKRRNEDTMVVFFFFF